MLRISRKPFAVCDLICHKPTNPNREQSQTKWRRFPKLLQVFTSGKTTGGFFTNVSPRCCHFIHSYFHFFKLKQTISKPQLVLVVLKLLSTSSYYLSVFINYATKQPQNSSKLLDFHLNAQFSQQTRKIATLFKKKLTFFFSFPFLKKNLYYTPQSDTSV